MKQPLKLSLFLTPLFGILLLLGLSACSGSKTQNPVSSSDEAGTVTEGEEGEKPKTYTAKSGDTLRKIAARPEIYSDPNLWPILQEANADVVGQSMSVNKGVELQIPRDLTEEQIDMAHEKARQVAASNKMYRRSSKRAESQPSAVPTQDATAAAAAAAAAVTPEAAQPVPPPKKGGILLPVLFVLLLILAALAVVLFYFMKKEKKEENQE